MVRGVGNTRYGVWKELRILRQRSNYTSAKLAEESGLAASYLSMLENGSRWPNQQVIHILSRVLNVPYTMLERKREGAA